jgi:hypothetical protein
MARKLKLTHSRGEITVAGSGRFPLDMLRYDQCTPRTGGDASAIYGSDDGMEFRVVNLYMYSAAGAIRPEIARWESFGWYVLTTDELAAFHADPSINAPRNLRDALALRQGEHTAAGNWPSGFRDGVKVP